MAVLAELSCDGGIVSEAFMQESSIDAGTEQTEQRSEYWLMTAVRLSSMVASRN